MLTLTLLSTRLPERLYQRILPPLFIGVATFYRTANFAAVIKHVTHIYWLLLNAPYIYRCVW